MGKLDGKVAIITGGSGGIGSAAARVFANEGAQIMLVDLDGDAMAASVAEIGDDKSSGSAASISRC